MELIKSANLALAFLLELCAVVAVGYWGFQIGPNVLVAMVLGFGSPLLLVVIWALFVAPRAAVPLPEPFPFILGLLILGLAATALAVGGRPILAIVFGLAIVANAALVIVWRQ